MKLPILGETDPLEISLFLTLGGAAIFLAIIITIAIFGNSRPCHQMKYLRTEHVPMMMIGKVIYPAHDDEIYRCLEGYEVTR